MAIVNFTQNIGSAVSLITANTIFSNSLRDQLQQRITEIGVSPDVIVGAGVRSIRDLVSGAQLDAVLDAYAASIDRVMYLGIGTAVMILVFAWGLGWKDIRKTREIKDITNDS
jgi:hypothetical protein